jgi:hypothetical protein
MKSHGAYIVLALGIVCAAPPFAEAQNNPTPDSVSTTPLTVSADYPRDRAGILILSTDWLQISSEVPAKTHLKHGLAPTFTYGIAPAAAVSQYEGLHSRVQIEPGQPVICICRLMSLPGNPALVRLHPKKTFRELYAGNLHIRSKVAEAQADDLIPVNVSQPESTVWLVQPKEALPAGEYALMLGTQNLSIFAFTVATGSPPPPATEKH